MWPLGRPLPPPPNMEEVRKQSRVLVIDDNALPAMTMFGRDGYHFERWSSVKNLSQLTDGHFHLILLDIQGVGLKESPNLQGLGILKHIKNLNPAQPVIVYSSTPQLVTSNEYLMLADALLDKGMSYVEYKERVDEMLLRRFTPGYFINAMNRALGEDAAISPKAVPMALGALRSGKVGRLQRYLGATLSDPKQVDKILTIIGIGIKAVRLVSG